MRLRYRLSQWIVQLRKHLLAQFPGLIRLYYRWFWTPQAGSLAAILDTFSRNHPDLFFIQVGANDGFQNDPLCKFIKRDHWRGICMEPQPIAFRDMAYLYHKDAVIPVNKALDATPQVRKLYRIGLSEDRWASGLSSFLKSQVEAKIADGYVDKKARKAGITPPDNPEDYITYDEVACIPFENLLKENQVEKVDLLHIDAEGYDFELLKLFPFDNFQPKLILFEAHNLSVEDYQACIAYLAEFDYQLERVGGDAVAKRGESEKLMR